LLGADIVAENSACAGVRPYKPEQGLDQRRFSRAVRTQQPDGASPERNPELAQNIAISKTHAQPIEFNYRAHFLFETTIS